LNLFLEAPHEMALPVRALRERAMSLDHSVAEFFARHHSPNVTHIVWVVTSIGNEVTLALATLLLLSFTVWRGRYRDTLLVLSGMAGASALTLGFKHVVKRARPGADFRAPGAGADHSYSFPSGHTLNTTVFVILLVAVLLPHLRARRSRVGAGAAAAVVAVAVGLSRLYLGYHWATDVLAGLLLGTTWALALVAWSRHWSVGVRHVAEAPPAVRPISSP
jgi:membrane-associated phospholipid phosphatase